MHASNCYRFRRATWTNLCMSVCASQSTRKPRIRYQFWVRHASQNYLIYATCTGTVVESWQPQASWFVCIEFWSMHIYQHTSVCKQLWLYIYTCIYIYTFINIFTRAFVFTWFFWWPQRVGWFSIGRRQYWTCACTHRSSWSEFSRKWVAPSTPCRARLQFVFGSWEIQTAWNAFWNLAGVEPVHYNTADVDPGSLISGTNSQVCK